MISYAFNLDTKPENPIPAGPYVLLNYSFSVTVTAGPPNPLASLTINPSGADIEYAIERDFTESIKGKVAANVSMDKMAVAVQNLDAKGFREAFGCQAAFIFSAGSTDIQFGYQLDKFCPIFLKLSGAKFSEIHDIRGERVLCEFSLEGGIYFGLSPQGWSFVIRKVGPTAIRRFLTSLGPRFASLFTELVAGGAITISLVVVLSLLGTAALIAATAAIVHNARTKGFGDILGNFYMDAYTAKVLNRGRPEISKLPMEVYVSNPYELIEKMIIEGEKDALIDAEATARKNGITYTGVRNREKEILSDYRLGWECRAIHEAEIKSWETKSWDYIATNLMKKMLGDKIKDKFDIEVPLWYSGDLAHYAGKWFSSD